MSLALLTTSLTGALAQGGNDPWDIRERTAYVVMMDGTMKTMDISDDGMKMLMKKGKEGAARHGVLHEQRPALHGQRGFDVRSLERRRAVQPLN